MGVGVLDQHFMRLLGVDNWISRNSWLQSPSFRARNVYSLSFWMIGAKFCKERVSGWVTPGVARFTFTSWTRLNKGAGCDHILGHHIRAFDAEIIDYLVLKYLCKVSCLSFFCILLVEASPVLERVCRMDPVHRNRCAVSFRHYFATKLTSKWHCQMLRENYLAFPTTSIAHRNAWSRVSSWLSRISRHSPRHSRIVNPTSLPTAEKSGVHHFATRWPVITTLDKWFSMKDFIDFEL